MEIIEDLGYIKQSRRGVILYNTCGYVTREGYLLAKYSSKNKKRYKNSFEYVIKRFNSYKEL